MADIVPSVESILVVLAAYLAGSVSFAVVICRLRGDPDPRDIGSGNLGATNAARSGGKAAAALTLLGDVGKAFAPVFAVRHAGFSDTVVALTVLAAFAGHLYPVYHRFRGGKGVAVCMGCLFGLQPVAGLAWAGVWLATAGLFRYVALAGVTAGLAAPLFIHWQGASGAVTAAVAVMGLAMLARHRDNLRRIARGEEGRLFR